MTTEHASVLLRIYDAADFLNIPDL